MKISRSVLTATLLALSVSIGHADCPYSFSCDSAGCTTLKHCAAGEPIPWSSADPGRSTFVLSPQRLDNLTLPLPPPHHMRSQCRRRSPPLVPRREAATATSANERGFLKRHSSMDTFAAMEPM